MQKEGVKMKGGTQKCRRGIVSRGAGRGFALAALFWALCLASPSGLGAEPSPRDQPQAAISAISASELERLSEISTRLASLNERLRTELEASRRSLSELGDSLAISTRELGTLRLELKESRRNSSELVSTAESSARESIALREALTRAEDSLKSSEASFEGYRRTAESRMLALSAGRLGLVSLAVSGWIAALAAVLAFALR